jgi:hypothetical protein
MKCTCPMASGRDCPEGCDARVYDSLPAAEKRKQRKSYAEKLYAQGHTMTRIAELANVSIGTISSDLANFSVAEKSKPTKTATNPKGAGRPKGDGSGVKRKHKPAEVKQAQRSVDVEPAVWETFKAKAKAEGKSAAEKLGELVQEPEVTRDALSMTAQQKFDTALRQAKLRMEAEIRRELHTEYREWLQRQLDQYNENARHYEKVLSMRRGVMSRTEYRSILSCLHPDRIQDETLKKRYADAFHLFTKLEKAVLNERESPTKPSDLPKTVDELMRRRAAYEAQRAADRAAKKRRTSTNVSV